MLRPVGRTALLLTPIVVVARGVAFLVPVAIAHLFGVSEVTDAFFYALAFPTFIMVIVANALSTVATPLMARVQKEDPQALDRFVGGCATSSGLVATSIGVLACASLPALLPRLTSFDEETRWLSWLFVVELLPFMAATGTAVVLRSAAEVRGAFLATGVTPFLRGSVVLAVMMSLSDSLGPHVLPAALLLGELVRITWYLIVLGRYGVRPRPNLVLDHRLRAAGRDALPILAGELMVAFNLLVDKAFAATLEPGSVSLLEYADRARLIPQSFVESTLFPVAFATWANLVAQSDRQRYAQQLDQSLRWLAALSAPMLAGLFIGRRVLVDALFARGEFGHEHAAQGAEVFGWYLPGMWTMLLGALAMRAHIVEGRLRLILILGVASVILNGFFDAMLIESFGVAGVALSSSLIWILVPAVYLAALAPTLRSVARASAWAPVLLVAGSAFALAAVVDAHHPVVAVGDPTLWICALVCLALVALGGAATRPGRSRSL